MKSFMPSKIIPGLAGVLVATTIMASPSLAGSYRPGPGQIIKYNNCIDTAYSYYGDTIYVNPIMNMVFKSCSYWLQPQ